MSNVTAFLTDSTLCIGCKACEVACKEWNQIPDDGFQWLGMSYDNTGSLGHSTWRHVKFVEEGATPGLGGNSQTLFPGVFLQTFASIARMPVAWKPVPPAPSCARNSAAFSFSRMFVMVALIASWPARSEWSSAILTTAARSSAHSATTDRKKV